VDPRLQAEIDRQEKQARTAAEAALIKETRRAYVTVFASDAGRRVLNDLRVAFYDRTSFVPGDPYATHVFEGERAVILRILTILAEESDLQKEPQQEAET
jgi:hypothetical protein